MSRRRCQTPETATPKVIHCPRSRDELLQDPGRFPWRPHRKTQKRDHDWREWESCFFSGTRVCPINASAEWSLSGSHMQQVIKPAPLAAAAPTEYLWFPPKVLWAGSAGQRQCGPASMATGPVLPVLAVMVIPQPVHRPVRAPVASRRTAAIPQTCRPAYCALSVSFIQQTSLVPYFFFSLHTAISFSFYSLIHNFLLRAYFLILHLQHALYAYYGYMLRPSTICWSPPDTLDRHHIRQSP